MRPNRNMSTTNDVDTHSATQQSQAHTKWKKQYFSIPSKAQFPIGVVLRSERCEVLRRLHAR